jgi:hypothetical protein
MKDTEKAICGAKTRSGKPCQKAPMKNGRCHLHGGKSLKGEEHPNFRHGKRSKYMPTKLRAIFEDVESDLEAHVLQRNLTLNESLLREKLQELEHGGDAAQSWKDMRDGLDSLKSQIAHNDMGAAAVTVGKMERVVDERERYHQAVLDIQTTMSEQRKDRTAIANIQYKGERAIPANELMVLMGGVLHVISQVVQNPQDRARIADGIDNLLISQK